MNRCGPVLHSGKISFIAGLVRANIFLKPDHSWESLALVALGRSISVGFIDGDRPPSTWFGV